MLNNHRRDFLKTLAAGYTARAMGYPANETIGVGVIGTGGRAQGLMKALWEAEDGTTRTVMFAELFEDVNRLANGLRELGLKQGDRVALCMPMVPEVVTIL